MLVTSIGPMDHSSQTRPPVSVTSPLCARYSHDCQWWVL